MNDKSGIELLHSRYYSMKEGNWRLIELLTAKYIPYQKYIHIIEQEIVSIPV